MPTAAHQPPPPDPTPAGRVLVAPGVALPADALRFAFSSSGGPGGQNVNKRATKAELRVTLHDLGLPAGALARLRHLAGHRVTDAGELILEADERRSQEQNKAACVERLGELLLAALTPPKPRKKTKPTRAAKARRLDAKRRRGATKRRRRADED